MSIAKGGRRLVDFGQGAGAGAGEHGDQRGQEQGDEHAGGEYQEGQVPVGGAEQGGTGLQVELPVALSDADGEAAVQGDSARRAARGPVLATILGWPGREMSASVTATAPWDWSCSVSATKSAPRMLSRTHPRKSTGVGVAGAADDRGGEDEGELLLVLRKGSVGEQHVGAAGGDSARVAGGSKGLGGLGGLAEVTAEHLGSAIEGAVDDGEDVVGARTDGLQGESDRAVSAPVGLDGRQLVAGWRERRGLPLWRLAVVRG